MNESIARPDDRLIPGFTSRASYSVDVSWERLESWMVGVGVPVDLDPDFQRAHVWTPGQQSAYVEFCLRGGHSAREVYWNCPRWPEWVEGSEMVIVDGKQRVEAVRRFMRGDVGIFGGWHVGDFGRRLLRGMEASFKCYVNGLETRAEVLTWYLEINAAGTPHTGGELDKVRAMLDMEAE